MEKNKITIHQAFYGEVDRGHSCIKQTIDDPELTSFLIAFTDRPGALSPGVTLEPYLSGSPYSRYYIFTKTFPDLKATRAGMVFTHVLILNLSKIKYINNLQDLFSFFAESVDDKNTELTDFQFEYENKPLTLEEKSQPKYIQQIISGIVQGAKPILFSGNIQTFSNALQKIWNSPNLESRKSLKFRTSFTTADIVDDLTIVSIQKDFLSKRQEKEIIYGDNEETIEITSHSEMLFLGYKDQNPFYDFLKKLNVELSDVQNFGKYENVFTDYISINEIDDANTIRQDIRVLSKISPSSKNGKKIKEPFIKRLEFLIENEKDSNIKALRNIDWLAFDEGERTGKSIVSEFIKDQLENPNQEQFQLLSEIIEISVGEKNKNWWHKSITEAIVLSFNKQNSVALKNIWKLVDLSQNTLQNILKIVSSVKISSDILRNSLPNKLRNQTYKTLLSVANKKKWYLLYADILLKQFTPEIALEKQLTIEQKLPLTKSIGVKYLSKKLTPKNLLSLTLEVCDKKIIDLSVESIIKDISLLKDINITKSCWFEIWVLTVLKTKKVFNGLEGKEKETVFSVLDFIIEGRNVDETLLALISDTPFIDISEYKNRSKVWEFLPFLVKEKFLEPTTNSILEDLLTEKIEANTIESEISDVITSNDYMSNFLNENKNNIEPVIKIYESFPNLKDRYLADYINYYRDQISEEQSKKLGELVDKYNYKKSARSIYDKSKYYNSFNTAYEICKEIVDVNWLESMWGSVGAMISPRRTYRKTYVRYTPTDNENMDRKNLPTVVILTAIKEEYMAVRSHLSELVEFDKDDTSYEAGIFDFNGKEIAKVFIRECGAKNTNASQETERAINHFTPDVILFVGIAGSRKPNDFSIGDVIFPEKVYSYEGGKSQKDSFVPRPDFGDITFALKEIAKKERRKEDWKILIKGDWKQEVKADLGIIASGEQIVEHYDSGVGKILSKHYDDTSAVEMEGFGFAKAASQQGRKKKTLVGVIRGISDIIEQDSKGKKAKSPDRRPAEAKKIASDTAAAFAFWLIIKTFEKDDKTFLLD